MRPEDLQAVELLSARLDLEPLRVDHAEEMAPLLNDRELHTFIGGEPLTLHQLRERFRHQVTGRSPDGRQRWLNWIVRRRADGSAVGTVQATVDEDENGLTAEVAWVVARPYQGHGYAREAAQCMVRWLRERGMVVARAYVHPDHAASQSVAGAVGLRPTDTVVEGEVRWESVEDDGNR